MSKYAKHFNASVTPQSEAIPGSTQVKNSAGGFSWAVDDWVKLDRFLVLGTEGGSYYAGERDLTKQSHEALLRCLAVDGTRTVKRIVEISEAGRAPKNDPAIFALAVAASKGNDATRKLALESLSRVCRTGTHLFQFLEAVQAFRGWGRGLRKAVGAWYTHKEPQALGYQLVKYRQRNGWAHRDALRLAKPSVTSPDINSLMCWTVGKSVEEQLLPSVVRAYIAAEKAASAADLVKIIQDNPALPWEAVPTQYLKDKDVMFALLPNMKMTAMIRNLGRLSAIELLTPMSEASKIVCAKLQNAEALKKERVHPVQVLAALMTYKSGHGVRSASSWGVVPKVVDALDEAFYAAFGNVQPAGKRTMLALDVSGSMGCGQIAGVPGLTPCIGSAAMAMITARTEEDWIVTAFKEHLTPLSITPRQRLDDIVHTISCVDFGGTDCAQPMLYALKNNLKIDTFVVYTDSETWAGRIHPKQAIDQYRNKTGIAAKLVVVGMVANNFTIADPDDAGMLDVVGFDTASPNLISDFSRGTL